MSRSTRIVDVPALEQTERVGLPPGPTSVSPTATSQELFRVKQSPTRTAGVPLEVIRSFRANQ